MHHGLCYGLSFSVSGLVPNVSLSDVLWDHGDLLAEEILRSSPFLRKLWSGHLTQDCYTSFMQQEAHYLQRVSSTLEVRHQHVSILFYSIKTCLTNVDIIQQDLCLVIVTGINIVSSDCFKITIISKYFLAVRKHTLSFLNALFLIWRLNSLKVRKPSHPSLHPKHVMSLKSCSLFLPVWS